MSGVDLGPGWAPLDIVSDADLGVVRVSQDDRDVIIPKTHLRRVIETLEALEKEIS